MEIEARKVEYVMVHISRRDTLEKIMDDMMRFIRPVEVAEYDDWFINASGDIVGVTEYYHGSDSNTVLGKATPAVLEVYNAIKTIRRNLDVLPSEDEDED